MIERFLGRTRRARRTWVFLTLVLTGLLTWRVLHLQFDYDFEKFFPEGEAYTEYFHQHRGRFGTDNDFLLISIKAPRGTVWDSEFLQGVDTLVGDLLLLDNVDTVISPTRTGLPVVKKGMMGEQVIWRPMCHPGEEAYQGSDSTFVSRVGWPIGEMFSADQRDISIFIAHTPMLSKKGCERLEGDVRSAIESHGIEDFRLAGRSVAQVHYIHVMEGELFLYITLSFILVVVFLVGMYRSLWGVILPSAVQLCIILVVLGGMEVAGQGVNLLITALPTILFVVGMSDVVHLLSRYRQLRASGEPAGSAMTRSIREVGMATLLTSVTTAVGFFTLMSIGVGPVREFAITAGLAVLVAFLVTYALLPALVDMVGDSFRLGSPRLDHRWRSVLSRAFIWVMRHKGRVVAVSLVFLAVTGFGLYQLRANYFILEDLKDGDPLKEDFRYFAQAYHGVRPFEVGVEILDPELDYHSPATLQYMAILDSFLLENYELKGVRSIHSVEQGIRDAYTDYGQKEVELSHGKIERRLKMAQAKGGLSRLVDSSGRYLRLFSKMPDRGQVVIAGMNRKFHDFMKENGDARFDVRLTGTAYLLDKNAETLSGGLSKGLGIAVLVVALLVGWMFRSWKVTLISMLPNAVPLLAVAAFMGFAGIYFQISTAIIFTIGFGIAVDDTIHFLSKYRQGLKKGSRPIWALRSAYLQTGKAILQTSFILISGFFLLVFSDFRPVMHIGGFISLILVVAVIADLTLLPAMLALVYSTKDSTAEGSSTSTELPKNLTTNQSATRQSGSVR